MLCFRDALEDPFKRVQKLIVIGDYLSLLNELASTTAAISRAAAGAPGSGDRPWPDYWGSRQLIGYGSWL